MEITEIKLKAKPGQDFWWFICSDLHIGSPSFDRQRWLKDMDSAQRIGARILINGDVCDAIDTRDKRFTADCIIPELQGKRDLIGAVCDLAFELLSPYAHLIELVGCGNHDLKWAKVNSSDPIKQIIDRLNGQLRESGNEHRVKHAGISGYIRTRFYMGEELKQSCATHDLWYHHGTGGDSPVTKGAIDFSRVESRWDADCYTMGHKHHRSATIGARGALSQTGIITRNEHLLIQTGSYFLNHRPTNGDPIAISYAEEFNNAPKPMGGWYLRLRPVQKWVGANKTSRRLVEQEVLSNP